MLVPTLCALGAADATYVIVSAHNERLLRGRSAEAAPAPVVSPVEAAVGTVA